MDANVQGFVQAIGAAYQARQSNPVALAQILTIAPQLHTYLHTSLRNVSQAAYLLIASLDLLN